MGIRTAFAENLFIDQKDPAKDPTEKFRNAGIYSLNRQTQHLNLTKKEGLHITKYYKKKENIHVYCFHMKV